jgi:hypothetical protein
MKAPMPPPKPAIAAASPKTPTKIAKMTNENLSHRGYASTLPRSASSGRTRARACSSRRSCSATGTQSASHAGQIAAVPWRVTQSAHRPRAHLLQMPSEGIAG